MYAFLDRAIVNVNFLGAPEIKYFKRLVTVFEAERIKLLLKPRRGFCGACCVR